MPRSINFAKTTIIPQLISFCILNCSVVRQVAKAEVSTTAGLGMFVLSDGNYSPLADVSLTMQRWKFTANLSGYSESRTKVTHALTGLLRQTPLDSGNRLKVEYGLGAMIAQTSVNGSSETMVNYTAPLGLCWSVYNAGPFVLEANWRSWIFASSPYLPFIVLLSHDRITTLALTLGVSL